MATDQEIVRAVQQGETERYGELVDRHQLAAWRWAFGWVGNLEDAKEISQNGFVKAYQQLHRFRGEAKFSTWLYRILVNECKDFLRSRQKQLLLLSPSSPPDSENPKTLFDIPDSSPDPRQAARQRELAHRLSEEIQRLPMNQRSAFFLHHLQGLPLQEVAQVMGCRLGTVKAHLFRAAEALRIRLEPWIQTEGWS